MTSIQLCQQKTQEELGLELLSTLVLQRSRDFVARFAACVVPLALNVAESRPGVPEQRLKGNCGAGEAGFAEPKLKPSVVDGADIWLNLSGDGGAGDADDSLPKSGAGREFDERSCLMVPLGDCPKLKVFLGVEERGISIAWSYGMPEVELAKGSGIGCAGDAAVLVSVAGQRAEKP